MNYGNRSAMTWKYPITCLSCPNRSRSVQHCPHSLPSNLQGCAMLACQFIRSSFTPIDVQERHTEPLQKTLVFWGHDSTGSAEQTASTPSMWLHILVPQNISNPGDTYVEVWMRSSNRVLFCRDVLGKWYVKRRRLVLTNTPKLTIDVYIF